MIQKVYCKNCKFYKRRGEYFLDMRFIEGDQYDEKFPTIIIPSGRIEAEGLALKHCQHPSCFKKTTSMSFESGLIRRKDRVAGCAQLNKEGDCSFYQPKFFYKLFHTEGTKWSTK